MIAVSEPVKLRMSRGWASQCLLTGLHVCAGIAACGSLVAVMLQWAQNLNCLPPVTDNFGDAVSVKNALGYACDIITYGSGVVCALNLMMAISVNCCRRLWCCSLYHQILTLLMLVLSTGCGAALTVDFILWCHSLQNTVGEYDGCASAADAYDKMHTTSNMTAYFRKMEMQQGCQWATVPFLLCAVVVYSVILKTDATEPQEPQNGQLPVGGRYYILTEESSPLLVPETPLPSNGLGRENTGSRSPVNVNFSTNHGEGAANIDTDLA